MSIALQWGYYTKVPSKSKGFLYFDAVTSLTEQYSGEVTKNPIDGGGNITDHFTKQNPVITISAVLSGVDISIKGVDVTDSQINGKRPMNDKSKRPVKTEPVNIKNGQKNALVSLLPDVVGRFFKPSKPDVVLAVQTPDTLKQMKELLKSLFSKDGVTLVSLYQYDNNNLRVPATSNLVMTSLVFKETPDSGDGLFCDITLEQVEFTKTKKEQIPNEVSQALASKGAQDATVQDGASENAAKSIQCNPSGKDSLASKGIPEDLSLGQRTALGFNNCAEEIAGNNFQQPMYVPPLIRRTVSAN